MVSYADMASRGREESRAVTTGRRKVIAERVEYADAELYPGEQPGTWVTARLYGSCGHQLLWLARVPVLDGEPQPGRYLTGRLGRRMTCPHDDCRIPPHVYTDADCEYITGAEVERRCRTRARWDTPMGRVCTRHRNHYLREGYLTDAEASIPVASAADRVPDTASDREDRADDQQDQPDPHE